ncbi:MAG: PrgI family protein [Parcubacteria group bacterium]|nr:PrgI family protein [Parcubacteria group bacterium]
MTRYEVPQFIEEEPKILGPISFKQIFIFLGALIASFIFFLIFKFWFALLLSSLAFGIVIALSFGKIQGRSIYALLPSIFRFIWQPKQAVWKKEELKAQELYKSKPAQTQKIVAKKEKGHEPLTPERIKELARQLDRKVD